MYIEGERAHGLQAPVLLDDWTFQRTTLKGLKNLWPSFADMKILSTKYPSRNYVFTCISSACPPFLFLGPFRLPKPPRIAKRSSVGVFICSKLLSDWLERRDSETRVCIPQASLSLLMGLIWLATCLLSHMLCEILVQKAKNLSHSRQEGFVWIPLSSDSGHLSLEKKGNLLKSL